MIPWPSLRLIVGFLLSIFPLARLTWMDGWHFYSSSSPVSVSLAEHSLFFTCQFLHAFSLFLFAHDHHWASTISSIGITKLFYFPLWEDSKKQRMQCKKKRVRNLIISSLRRSDASTDGELFSQITFLLLSILFTLSVIYNIHFPTNLLAVTCIYYSRVPSSASQQE